MTRFFIPVSEAARLMAHDTRQGRVVVPVMQAVRMGDVAAEFGRIKKVGRRPGERLHEWAVAPGEHAWLDGDVYVLGGREELTDGYSSEKALKWQWAEFREELAEVLGELHLPEERLVTPALADHREPELAVGRAG
jgi:hypothetical protein